MARYHLGKDGPMKCSAQIQCPLQKKAIENGEDPNQIFHYPNKAAAMQAYSEKLETKNADTVHTGLRKTVSNSSTLKVVDISSEIDPDAMEYGIYTGTRISGRIDAEKLNENSYKDFGFIQRTGDGLKQKYTQYAEAKKKRVMAGGKAAESYGASLVDSDKLSENERNAFTYYTGVGYSLVNHSLFANSSSSTKSSHSEVNPIAFRYVSENDREKLTKLAIEGMDTGLEKANKWQKIVYRGAANDVSKDDHGNISKWIKENRGIGTVLEYPGYTSASHVEQTALGFGFVGEGDEMLYEIMTPEGIWVDSMSSNSGEEEVVLPRDQKYVIVGNYQTEDISSLGNNTLYVVQMVAVNDDLEILDGTNSTKPRELG